MSDHNSDCLYPRLDANDGSVPDTKFNLAKISNQDAKPDEYGTTENQVMSKDSKTNETPSQSKPEKSGSKKKKGFFRHFKSPFTKSSKESIKEEEDTKISQEPPNDHTWQISLKSLKLQVKKESYLIKKGPPKNLQLPLVEESRDELTSIRNCHICADVFPASIEMNEKVLLVVGATGTGKTTLINAFANFAFDVQWEDNFRFEVLQDKQDIAKLKSDSQTSMISVYTFYTIKKETGKPFKVTIVDTPGYGDTGGIFQDQDIDKKMKHLFCQRDSNFKKLHAVCFVAKASETRLTEYQKYVYEKILSMFGRDVERIILIIATFADAGKPKVIEGLKDAKIPYQKLFKFNNSALTSNNVEDKDDDDVDFDSIKSTFNKSMESFKNVFKFLDENDTPVELEMTKQVLQARENLEQNKRDLKMKVEESLVQMDKLKKTKKAVEKCEENMQSNKNHTIVYYETVSVMKDDRPSHNMNCKSCKRTCHHICDSLAVSFCTKFTWKLYCTGCECYYSTHYLEMFKYVNEVTKKEKTVADVYAEFQKAVKETVTKTAILKNLESQLAQTEKETLEKIDEIRKSVEYLDEYALKDNTLTTVDHINMMIEDEEKAPWKIGFEERVAQLKKLRVLAAGTANEDSESESDLSASSITGPVDQTIVAHEEQKKVNWLYKFSSLKYFWNSTAH